MATPLNSIPVPFAHDTLAPILYDLVEEIRAELAEKVYAVGRVVHLAPGADPAWDNCCDGQLYSKIVDVEPVYPENRKADGSYCAPVRWTVTAAVGVLRCAAVLDDRGVAPRPSAITANGYEMSADMLAILGVLACSTKLSEVLRWEPLGVEGGCHGGEWQFIVSLGG